MGYLEDLGVLANVSQQKSGSPTDLHIITGEVVERSEDGQTVIAMDGIVISEENNQSVEMSTLGGLEEGDTASILLAGASGGGMQPLVLGSPGSVDRIRDAAFEAKDVAEATGQHFWTDTNGIHVTNATQEGWNDESSEDYHEGANVLLNSIGMLFRWALNPIMALLSGTEPGVVIYDGEGEEEENIVAQFKASGAQIGKSDSQHAVLSSTGLSVYNGDETLAAINGVDLERAAAAADQAERDAAAANQAASEAQASATAASVAAADADAKAVTAGAAANAAQTSADAANQKAIEANTAANGAVSSLGVVEDVLGTLNWIHDHGSYSVSTDTEVVEGTSYFTRSGSGASDDPYVYTLVTPEGTENPSQLGWYELDIQDALGDYVGQHLALMDDGLHVVPLSGGYYVVLSNDGMRVYSPTGVMVSKYGEGMQLGSMHGIHMEADGSRLSFFSAGFTYPRTQSGAVDYSQLVDGKFSGEVAYIAIDPDTNESVFYMNRAVVVSELRFGKWKWYGRRNNNLALKWIG